MATITILAGLLGATKESIAQNLASNQKNKDKVENISWVNNNANTLANEDPLAFTQQNVIKYFWTNNKDLETLRANNKTAQELQYYTNSLIKKLGNWTIKNNINDLIRKHIIKNISDPRQQIRSIMYALESEIFWWDASVKSVFWDIFIPEEKDYWNFDIVSSFWEEYIKLISSDLDRIMKEIEQWNQRIEQWNQRIEQWMKKLEENRLKIENTMGFITPEIVKEDPKIKERIIYRRQRYKDLKQEPTNPHIIDLFKALDE